ncbi:AraC family transcriptional regulator N-terminal domain-containing protein [Agrobacterium salinitolerans]
MENLDQLCALAVRHAGSRHPSLSRLTVYQHTNPTEFESQVYDPTAFIVLQGVKTTVIGDKVFDYGPGETVIAAAEVVAMERVAQATLERPFLALALRLDPAVITNVVLYLSETPELKLQPGLGFSIANSELIAAWERFLAVLDRPKEIPVMGLHLEHELMFRLMMGPHAEALRQIAGIDSRLSHIRRAMAWIREHYAEQITVDEMAAVAGMSESVFHRRFKAVTGMSPLQYQKHIRLQEARKRMISRQADAGSVSYDVGYKSISQFSREYKRLFGAPPRRDAGLMRTTAETQ